MERRLLGRTDLEVSRIGFGCEPLGGADWGRVDERLVAEAVQHALETGINVFDTADVYGLGRSEERLSEALGSRRHEVVIVTKFGLAWETDSGGGRARTFRDAGPEQAVRAVESSLRRLRLDVIPVWLVHWPDPATPLERTLEAMVRLRERGLVRHLGLSNFDAAQIEQALSLAPISVIEIPYSMIDRGAERDLLPLARRHGLGVIAYGVLAQGLLTGKYGASARFPDDDRRHRLPHFKADRLAEQAALLDRVGSFGGKRGLSPSQVAIGWVLAEESVTCALAGAKTSYQVAENAGAAGWHMTGGERESLATGGEASSSAT